MSYLYRCKCGLRRSLKRKHTDYVYKPKCKACQCELTYRDCWQEKKNLETVCNCEGAGYPHRAGSILFCVQSLKVPTHEDYAHYYNVDPTI